MSGHIDWWLVPAGVWLAVGMTASAWSHLRGRRCWICWVNARLAILAPFARPPEGGTGGS